MLFTTVTLTILVGTVLVGIGISLWMDRAEVCARTPSTAARKPGTLPARLPMIFLNLMLVGVLSGVPLYMAADRFPMGVPTLGMAIGQFLFLLLVDDLVFYIVHRTLHQNKFLYRVLHKRHHEAFAPVPCEYLYVHPLEWMLGALGPALGIGGLMVFLGEISVWPFWAWCLFRTLHELWIHSGHPSTLTAWIPLYGVNEHHDRHHARPTLGNYAATLTLWDKLLGTEIQASQIKRPSR